MSLFSGEDRHSRPTSHRMERTLVVLATVALGLHHVTLGSLWDLEPAELGLNCTKSEIFGKGMCLLLYNKSAILRNCTPNCQIINNFMDCVGHGHELTNPLSNGCLQSIDAAVRHFSPKLRQLLLDDGQLKACDFTNVNALQDLCPNLHPLTKHWSPWDNRPSSCGVTCGEGVRYKMRRCLNSFSEEVEITSGCPGVNRKSEPCRTLPCPTKATTSLATSPASSYWTAVSAGLLSLVCQRVALYGD